MGKASSINCHDTSKGVKRDGKGITVGFAGQPNTGKSTIFNRITGLKQHVGNWPGKTVEQKTGKVTHNNSLIYCVDLPGTYSLSTNSLEEKITREFILKEKPDVVVVVIDASQLERTSYLLAEIVDLQIPYVLALNMIDVAQNMGIKIDAKKMQEEIGAPVVPLVAAKGKGISELLEAISEVAQRGELENRTINIYKDEIDSGIQRISEIVKEEKIDKYPAEWTAIKMLEGDEEIIRYCKDGMLATNWFEIKHIRGKLADGRMIIAGQRYNWISEIMKKAVKRPNVEELSAKRGKFDKIATHPILGYLLAMIIIVTGLVVTVVIGMPVSFMIMGFVPTLSAAASSLLSGMPSWLSGSIVFGLIPGVGIGIAMGSMVMAIAFVLGTLEDIGYMARLGYLFNSFTKRIGLHGKAFMPLLLSLVCNVSGIVGSRVMDSWKQRMLLLVMASIIPCTALIPIIGLIVLQFFTPAQSLLIYSGLAVATVLHLMFTARLFGATFLKGKQTGLIMELPPYHKPNWRTIFIFVEKKGKKFLKEAVTIIAAASVIVWFLSYFPGEGIDNSYLASFANLFEPIANLMGWDWRLFTSWLTAGVTKGTALSTMAVLYGISAPEGTSIMGMMVDIIAGGGEYIGLGAAIRGAVSQASALAFVFAVYFSVPCLASVGVVYSETGSLKWTLGTAAYYTGMSLIAGIIAYQVGMLIF